MSKATAMSRNNLTEGPVLKKLLMFAVPTIAGNLIMQLYNVVDSIVVGNYVGTKALAAVGSSFPIMMLFNALFMGVSMGAQIVISQTFGAKNYPMLQTVINTAVSIAFIIGTAITVIGSPLVKPLLKLLGTPADILDNASTYLLIIFLGTLGNIFYNQVSGAMRGMGDSRWPLIALVISSVTNVVLDIVFVANLGMGVAGVAWATLISHFLSGLVLLFHFQKGSYPVKIQWIKLLKPNREASSRIFALGMPSALQHMAQSLGGIVIQTFANTFGSDYIAANTIVMKADGFAMMPMFGIGMACTSFVGQNIGAGNRERAKKGIHAGIACAVTIAAFVGVVLFFTGKYIMMAFGADGQVLYMGVSGIHFLAFCYMFMGIDGVVGGSMRGAGAAIAPACTAITSNLCRIPLAYFLAVRPLKNAMSNLLATGSERLTSLTTEYMGTGLYETTEAARKAAAANICSVENSTGLYENFMGMFMSMGISMAIGATLIFLYFKFGKWHNKAVKFRGPGGRPAPAADGPSDETPKGNVMHEQKMSETTSENISETADDSLHKTDDI